MGRILVAGRSERQMQIVVQRGQLRVWRQPPLSAPSSSHRPFAFADVLGLDRFDVVDQSFGGFWGLSMAFAHRERLSGLVVWGEADETGRMSMMTGRRFLKGGTAGNLRHPP